MNTVPVTNHPSWCDGSQCDVATHDLEGFGAHRSRPVILDLGLQVLAEVASVRVQLQYQPRPWPTVTVVTIEAGRGRVTLDLPGARRVHREVGVLLSAAEDH